MIRITNLNKYYNKNTRSENHVISDFSYTFEDSGLYAFFGPSGCGKTTLLNVLGGLDSFNSGTIEYDGLTCDKYVPRRADEIRNDAIGFIFQNYNLIESMTVSENVMMSLDIAGIKNAEERKNRVEECLKAVGLFKYRRRNVTALSGGERQRVAIARALAKNPRIILADEPTGNLDSNNTFEVMNIIKKISRDRLVILVSHEKNLVDFYADRIIELKDGKMIGDIDNSGDKSYGHNDTRNIYLKDYEKKSSDSEIADINVYGDGEKVKIDIVFKNGEAYIKCDSKEKVHFIDDRNEIKFLEMSESEFHKELEEKESDFEIGSFNDSSMEKKNLSIFRYIGQGFKKKRYIKKNVFTIIVLVIIGLSFSLSFSKLAATFHVEKKDYLYATSDAIRVELTNKDKKKGLTIDTLKTILDSDTTVKSYTGSTSYTTIHIEPEVDSFYQSDKNHPFYTTKPIVYQALKSNNSYGVTIGRDIENEKECVISTLVAEAILDIASAKYNGYQSMEDLIGMEVAVGSYNVSLEYNLRIVGITNDESMALFVKEADMIDIRDDIDSSNSVIMVSSTSKEALKQKLIDAGYSKVTDPNDNAWWNTVKDKIKASIASIVIRLIMIIAVILYLSLINRTQTMRNVKEIGIMRTIGASKSQILKMYSGEMFALTTLTAIVSYTIVYFIILYFYVKFPLSTTGLESFYPSPLVLILGIAFIYALSILSSIIPVSILMSKTPVEIIKKYDI